MQNNSYGNALSSKSKLKRKHVSKNIAEQPSAKRFVYKDTYQTLIDPNLPQELTVLFQPLFCKLCDMNLSSISQTKIHYQSKNHKKKVKAWVIEWSKKTGQLIPLTDQVISSTDNSEDDPKYIRCDLCDIDFTSKMHAESHYMGRNHQKVLSGQKNMLKNGYYDEEGKFHRTTKKTDSRFGIGSSFTNPVITPDSIQKEDITSPVMNPQIPVNLMYSTISETNSNNLSITYSPTITQSPSGNVIGLYCSYCAINTTSPDQMASHLKGQRHIKTLKKMGVEVTEKVEPKSEPSLLTTVTNPSIARQNNSVEDYSIFRTPSGNYYCSTCNLSVPSEIHFKQHIQSKKHTKNKHKS